MSSPILPKARIARVGFLEARLPGWLVNALALGTTAPTITSLTGLTNSARAAYEAQQLAIGQAKAATQNFYDAVGLMSDAASDVIKQVKVKAATGGGNAVYTLAVLPVPATPTPVPPPGTPSDFRATLTPDGALQLAWKCANPSGSTGTVYQISRRTGGGTGGFVTIGSSGQRKFLDLSVPAGVASVTYQIAAVRSTASGTPAQFLVNFGTIEGEAFASVTGAPKLAA